MPAKIRKVTPKAAKASKVTASANAKPVKPAKVAVARTKASVTPRVIKKAPPKTVLEGPMHETGAEQFDSVNEMVRQYAEHGLEKSLAAFDGLRDAADAATVSFEEGTDASRKAGEKVFAMVTDMMTQQSEIACDTMKAMTEADSANAAMEIWWAQCSQQFDAIAQKQQDLSEAFSGYFETASRPFANAYGKAFAA